MSSIQTQSSGDATNGRRASTRVRTQSRFISGEDVFEQITDDFLRPRAATPRRNAGIGAMTIFD